MKSVTPVSIDLMIKDLIKNTKKNLSDHKIKSLKDIYKSRSLVDFSDKIKERNEIRFFLKSKMYNNKKVQKKNDKKINYKKIIYNTNQPDVFTKKYKIKNV